MIVTALATDGASPRRVARRQPGRDRRAASSAPRSALGLRIGGGVLRRRRGRPARAPRPTTPCASGRRPPATATCDVDAILAAALATGRRRDPPRLRLPRRERRASPQAVRGGGHRLRRPDARRSCALFGVKHSARALARGGGRAAARRAPACWTTLDEAVAAAAEPIGYPVMLKATAGGGGIGMRVCARRRRAAPTAFDARARGSAARSFGAAGVFLERYVARARHVEVQIFGDGQGRVVALGDRDCSLQRRNQKVVEEAPAPGPARRGARRCSHASARRARRVGGLPLRRHGRVRLRRRRARRPRSSRSTPACRSSTRVTEEVIGVDLVEWMLRLRRAATTPVARRRRRRAAGGHAVEVRALRRGPGARLPAERRHCSPRSSVPDRRVRASTPGSRPGTEVTAVLRPDAGQGHRARRRPRRGASAALGRRARRHPGRRASRPTSACCARSCARPSVPRRRVHHHGHARRVADADAVHRGARARACSTTVQDWPGRLGLLGTSASRPSRADGRPARFRAGQPRARQPRGRAAASSAR